MNKYGTNENWRVKKKILKEVHAGNVSNKEKIIKP